MRYSGAEVGGVPARVRWYIAGCSAAAIAAGFGATRADPELSLGAALGFGLLTFLSEQFPIRMPDGTSYSVSFVITIAATIAAGPAEATIATMCGTLSLRGARERPIHRHVFNASQLALTAALGALAYHVLGGPVGTITGLFPAVIVPLAAATAVNFGVNTALVSGAISLSEGTSWRAVWLTRYAGLASSYVAFALLGVLLGALHIEMGWASVLFLLAPLLVARHAFQAAVTMQGAFDDMVRTLIAAIEAKDPYTRGHAERVSRLAEMTARSYGLPPPRLRVIGFAALMHDVGKLGVSSGILRKPGKLTPDEYEHMKQHPIRGHEIVSGIDLLAGAVAGVRHHHERIDGAGYPDGLRGDQIPLFARLIMVADAFDSMTSTRTYRKAKTIEEAFAELWSRAGTQFDGHAIAALARAIREEGWEPQPEASEPRARIDLLPEEELGVDLTIEETSDAHVAPN